MINKRRDRREDPAADGKLAAEKDFRAIVDGEEIDSGIISKLWRLRQEKIRYADMVKTDFYFWLKVRKYWECYLSELDRLILDGIGSISVREPVLSLKGWN